MLLKPTQWEFLPRVRREGEAEHGHAGDEEARHDQVVEVVPAPLLLGGGRSSTRSVASSYTIYVYSGADMQAMIDNIQIKEYNAQRWLLLPPPLCRKLQRQLSLQRKLPEQFSRLKQLYLTVNHPSGCQILSDMAYMSGQYDTHMVLRLILMVKVMSR